MSEKTLKEAKNEKDVLLNEVKFFTDEKQAEIKNAFRELKRRVGICASAGSEGDNLVLLNMLDELCDLSQMLTFMDCKCDFLRVPSLRLYDGDGNYSGIAFSGVAGGYEIDALVFAICNLGGAAEKLPEDLEKRIKAINKPLKIQIATSLSCKKCPSAVINAQKIAALNDKIEAEAVDVDMFSDMREKYGITRVPTIIVNERVLECESDVESILCELEKGLAHLGITE